MSYSNKIKCWHSRLLGENFIDYGIVCHNWTVSSCTTFCTTLHHVLYCTMYCTEPRTVLHHVLYCAPPGWQSSSDCSWAELRTPARTVCRDTGIQATPRSNWQKLCFQQAPLVIAHCSSAVVTILDWRNDFWVCLFPIMNTTPSKFSVYWYYPNWTGSSTDHLCQALWTDGFTDYNTMAQIS